MLNAEIDQLPPPTLDLLPRVPSVHAPTAEQFASIVAAEKPVILEHAFETWPALAAGRESPQRLNEYLRQFDAGASVPVMEAPASSAGWYFYSPDMREFNFSKRQARLGETLDLIDRYRTQPNSPFVAIQMLPLATHLPAFLRENSLPWLPTSIAPRLWLGGPMRTQTHNDRDHNVACVIAGRRRFILFPPEQVGNLYVGPLDNPPPLSMVNPEAPDLDRFPRFRQAVSVACVAHLAPGDALFIPKYWWHHVTSVDPYNAMVNYWWGDSASGLERANDCFLTALLAFKNLPAGERAYWRAMFETYVFRAEDRDPVAHIPRELQGVLGSMSKSLRTKLKQQLKMAYLKS